MGSQGIRYNRAKELNWTDAELLGYFCTLAFPCEFGTWRSRWNTFNKDAEHRFVQNFHNTGENGKQFPTVHTHTHKHFEVWKQPSCTLRINSHNCFSAKAKRVH